MKNVKRLRARLALNNLRESKAWIASKKLVLETEEGDLEINKGDQVILGATKEGEVAIKDPQAIVVVADDELAAKIVDAMKNASELDDVKFMDKPALDAALDGETVEDLVAGLVDAEEGDEVEVATVDAEDESTVEEKCQKIAENVIELTGKVLSCESLLIDEADDAQINLGDITQDVNSAAEMSSYEEFKNAVAEMQGSVAPGDSEIAFDAEGKAIGYWDNATQTGKMFNEPYATADDMLADDLAPVPAVQPAEFEADATETQMEMVEEALKAYEESAKSAKDLFAMAESLEKAGLSESSIATVANSFVSRSLTEGVNVFDTKLGKVVATFKESVDANNYIAESGEEARFTKRFFQEAK